MRLLFGPLASRDAQLIGLSPEYMGDADTELVGLDHCRNKPLQVFDAGSQRQVPQCFASRLAGLRFHPEAVKLGGQWVLLAARERFERAVKALAGLDADGQDVDRVRKKLLDRLLPLLDLLPGPEIGEHEAAEQTDRDTKHKLEEIQVQQERQEEKRNRPADERQDAFDPEEVLHCKVARISRLGEHRLRFLD